jgi:hypothetical protein
MSDAIKKMEGLALGQPLLFVGATSIVKVIESWYNTKHKGQSLSTNVHHGFRRHKYYKEVMKRWRSKK